MSTWSVYLLERRLFLLRQYATFCRYEELGRWYNINVIFENKELMDLKIRYFCVRNETLERAVTLLNHMKKIKVPLAEIRYIFGKTPKGLSLNKSNPFSLLPETAVSETGKRDIFLIFIKKHFNKGYLKNGIFDI